MSYDEMVVDFQEWKQENGIGLGNQEENWKHWFHYGKDNLGLGDYEAEELADDMTGEY